MLSAAITWLAQFASRVMQATPNGFIGRRRVNGEVSGGQCSGCQRVWELVGCPAHSCLATSETKVTVVLAVFSFMVHTLCRAVAQEKA